MRAYIELDLAALRHNVALVKTAIPAKCQVMAVLKGNAYGHGISVVGPFLNQLGIHHFAVATVDEAIELRQAKVKGEILILGPTEKERIKDLVKYDLTQTLIGADYCEMLHELGYPIKGHIKIDTGMHRLGFDYRDVSRIKHVFTLKNIKVLGMYSHLCMSDSSGEEAIAFTKQQIANFYTLVDDLRPALKEMPKLHLQATYGLLNYPELNCDFVRIGAALYGTLNTPHEVTKLQLDLQPVLSLKSKIVLLRKVKKGESVGYGRAFIAKRDSVIATVSIGYGDGYSRQLSCGKGQVLVRGQLASVVGRICMDQLCIDVTDILDVCCGDVVTLIGRDSKLEMSAPMVAVASGTMSPELLSRLGKRLSIVTSETL